MPGVLEPKVAIVCDWLTGYGGAERVVFELHKLFPHAPIYTSQYDPKKIGWFIDADVRTSWLQHLPSWLKKFLPVLRAWSFSHLDLSQYDLVISSSGAEAKAIKVGAQTTHICYCHSPTHYYWIRYNEYLRHPGFPTGFNWLARLGFVALAGPMRWWDRRAAQRPTVMLANSTYTQAMIKKYYNRDSTVIFPPVDTERFTIDQAVTRHGFVVAGRQTPYKRIDLAVIACSRLNVPLTVIGEGPDHHKLRKLAGPSINFKTDVSDTAIVHYFQSAKALIMPSNVEDFGVTAVEAMAAGTPVITYNKGGPLDYVIPNKTGLFFDALTAESLIATLQQFDSGNFDPVVLRETVNRFSKEAFFHNMKTFISQTPAPNKNQ